MVTVLYTWLSRKSVNVLFSASYMLFNADELETLEELYSDDKDGISLEELSSDEDENNSVEELSTDDNGSCFFSLEELLFSDDDDSCFFSLDELFSECKLTKMGS